MAGNFSITQYGCSFDGEYSGSGSLNQGNTINITQSVDECLPRLYVTDPRIDKKRIEDTKGGLLTECYDWVLQNDDFRRWRDDQAQRLLWIKGDPGKGKTMLLCGIINELEATPVQGTPLSYFFCEASDERLHSAKAVLRGLISMLLKQDSRLFRHVKEKYDEQGSQLFDGKNAWYAMSDIFIKMLKDFELQDVRLIIDALDECLIDLEKLLTLITITSQSTTAKWLVSSRHCPRIEEDLRLTAQNLSLEINRDLVSTAVSKYIEFKVSKLKQLKDYKNETASGVRNYLLSHANDTFLWVALVCQELKNTDRWHALEEVKLFPSGLDALYERMMRQIVDQKHDVELRKQILALVATTFRPLSLTECIKLIECHNWPDDPKFYEFIINTCGSFLAIREDTIYFVHQSAKEFLLDKSVTAFQQILPRGRADQHHIIFSRSLDVLSKKLKRDIYDLEKPGCSIEDISPPNPDPLASIKYLSTYWVDHVEAAELAKNPAWGDLQEDGTVHTFLEKYYLYWLEAQSLIKGVPQAVVALQKLLTLLANTDSRLTRLVQDGYRFVLSHRQCIESFPLQLYTSTLLFSPTRSLIKHMFEPEPRRITMLTEVDADWNACLQTIEGHYDMVLSVAFSAHGQYLASSAGNTIKLWDQATGHHQQTLKGHSDWVFSVAFSAEGLYLASGSVDTTIKLWDIATGDCQQTLEGHGGWVKSVAFSAKGLYLASGSVDTTIKLWDLATGHCQQTLSGHDLPVNSVAFSVNGQLASASSDKTIKLWDLTKGQYQCQQTLVGHTSDVSSVAFSADGRYLASGSRHFVINLWDIATGHCQQTLSGHDLPVNSVAFSVNGQLASASSDKTIKLWDLTTGQYKCQQTLVGHNGRVQSVAFSADGRHLASASVDTTIKLWDIVTGQDQCQETLESHHEEVKSLAFSANGRSLVSASYDGFTKFWDTTTGRCQGTLGGHLGRIMSTAFSADGRYLVSTSHKGTAKLWDTATGRCQQTLSDFYSKILSTAFSADGQYLASISYKGTVKLWDTATGRCQRTLSNYNSEIRSVAFSASGQQLALASSDNIKLWDTLTGQCQQILEGHSSQDNSGLVQLVTFSADGQYLASASDKIIKLWNLTSSRCQHTLKGHKAWVNLLAFLPNEQQLVSISDTKTLKLWNLATGECQQTLEGYDSSDDLFAIASQHGPMLSQKSVWITNNSENILWLPPEYRAVCHAVNGLKIAIGCRSGRVLLFQVSDG